ncbi:MAG TPA: heparin lyase I family protein, partial [Rariglobus sp.]
GWYGFSFYAPESFPAPGKAMVLGQLHGYHSLLPNANVTVTLVLDVAGKLIVEGTYGTGTSVSDSETTVYTTIAPKLTKGGWHDVILYVKYSNNNTGALKVWLDGAPETAPTASFTGIKLGNGGWTGNTMTYGTYIKWGPYCWDSANYTTGETREIYYDEIAYQAGNPAGSFNLVKPSGYGTGYAPPPAGPVVMTETFDALVTGSWPAGWTVSYAANTTVSVREDPSATDKSMRFYDANSTALTQGTKTFTAQTGRVSASWSFKQSGQGEGHSMMLMSGTLSAIELYTVGGNLVYRDGSGADIVLQAVPANIWYDVEVIANPATFKADVYVGGVRKLTGASYRNVTTSVDRVRFATSDASASVNYFVNDVVIAKAGAIFTETYDNLPTGSLLSGWLRTYSSNTAVTVREVPSATDKSMMFYDNNGALGEEAYNLFVPQTATFAASWSFKQSVPMDGDRMGLASSAGKGAAATAAVEFHTLNGNLYYRNGAGTDLLVQAIPANVWYDIKVVVHPATTQAEVYVNGVQKLTSQSLRNPVTSVNRVVFGTAVPIPLGNLYINSISVNDNDVPAMAPLAANIPRVPIVLKLDDLNTSLNVPFGWARIRDLAVARNIKFSAGLVAKSLEVGSASYLTFVQNLKTSGRAEVWFHGYDHSTNEFVGSSYADQKNRFVTSQALAMTKLGFPLAGFGAPGNVFDDTTVQVMAEDPEMNVWIYGDPARPAGKVVLDRVSLVNIEQPTFVPNPERFVGGYQGNYAGRQYFVIQGHPYNWTTDARWVEFVRLIDWLQANGFTFTTPTELADSL